MLLEHKWKDCSVRIHCWIIFLRFLHETLVTQGTSVPQWKIFLFLVRHWHLTIVKKGAATPQWKLFLFLFTFASLFLSVCHLCLAYFVSPGAINLHHRQHELMFFKFSVATGLITGVPLLLPKRCKKFLDGLPEWMSTVFACAIITVSMLTVSHFIHG